MPPPKFKEYVQKRFESLALMALVDVPLKQLLKDPQQAIEGSNDYAFVVCRLGNDSQIAADALRGAFPDTQIQDVVGGLRMWSIDVDESFPQY